MRIVVSGAGGFVGCHVLAELAGHDVIAADLNLEQIPDASNITKVSGDLQDPDTLREMFQKGCDAVIHLATVPGGAAEANPALAKSVNIDGTMALIAKAIETSDCPRLVFASSIAVFGKLPPEPISDEVPTAPTMIYGVQKLMMEQWIATLSRRGAIKGLSLRLPGIVARPRSPSGMKSAFLSDLFHALRDNEDYTMPVSVDATSWLCSVQVAAKNIVMAALSDDCHLAESAPLLTPTLNVKMIDLENEIRRQFGSTESQITYEPDHGIQSIFGEHPDVLTPKACGLGYLSDNTLETLVKNAVSGNVHREQTHG